MYSKKEEYEAVKKLAEDAEKSTTWMANFVLDNPKLFGGNAKELACEYLRNKLTST